MIIFIIFEVQFTMKKSCISIALALVAAMLSGCGITEFSDPSSDVFNTDETSASDIAVKDADAVIDETEAPSETLTEMTTTGKAPLVTVSTLPDKYQIDVEPIMQEPELPTGCEITSLTCLLNYLGFDVDKVVMADTYLDYILENGTDYSFFEKYIGDPHSNGYGCYSPVIVKAAAEYLADQNSSLEPVNLSGSTEEELFYVIASDHPIVIWNTLYAQYVEGKYVWTTPDGEDVYWNNYEHCMLLSGYDIPANTVTLCDPLRGEVQYDIDQFFTVYNELMYQQAMTIY